jgi:superfamily I DNA/RNA helicase
VIEDRDHDAVLLSTEPHRVVVAPPGTGKTLLSVRLAGRLTHELNRHERVLLLTFSNQARGQLEREARAQLTALERPLIEITNYHKLFLRGVSAYRRVLGLPAGMRLVPLAVRKKALLDAGPEMRKYLTDGVAERLAEWRFAEFRDAAVLPDPVLEQLLDVVDAEHLAGRLVFDDLGALFWRVLNECPAVETAYRSRFPHVIADEHQDASGLQDALVRRLAAKSMTILCDPMQLIHGYRGADEARLRRHQTEGKEFTLQTAHRWRNAPLAGEWLLAVRARLLGRANATRRVAACTIERTPDRMGLNGAVTAAVAAVRGCVSDGHKSIAVLVPTRMELAAVRKRLCTAGFQPRQVGASHDLDDAYEVLEALGGTTTSVDLARLALAQFTELVPAFPTEQERRIDRRLGDRGVNTRGARPDIAAYLERFGLLYEKGKQSYLPTLSGLLTDALAHGYALPRHEFCNLIHAAAREPDDARAIILGQLSATLVTRTVTLQDGLFVMTTHQAKGREFDAVVMAYASERSYTSTTTAGRNVFYVGVTRGMYRWHVIAPESSMTKLVAALG